MSKYANDLDMMSQALLAQMQRERDDAIKASMQMQRERDDAIKASMQDMATVESLRQCEPVAWHGITGDYGFPFLSFQEQPGMTPLYTHPAPAVPYDVEKWQLVPIEPTQEMIKAGMPETEGHYSLPYSLYKAMLQAAPKPEK